MSDLIKQQEQPPQPVGLPLLVAFTQELVRHATGDVTFLALARAKTLTHATEEEVRALRDAIFRERKAHGTWPDGFMP